MTGYASALGSEYDAFLYAPLYRDEHETMLSVVSALARLDIDPWSEAAKLARLPKTAATTQLAALISRIPGGLPRHLDARATASQLVGLLPVSVGPVLLRPTAASGIVARYRTAILIFVLFILVAFGVRYLVGDRVDRGGSVETSPSAHP